MLFCVRDTPTMLLVSCKLYVYVGVCMYIIDNVHITFKGCVLNNV